MVGNVSIAWITSMVQSPPAPPFFAYIAPKAAHEPFIPAPWCAATALVRLSLCIFCATSCALCACHRYLDAWDASWPAHEPRDNPAYNCSAASRAGKHGNIRSEPMLTEEAQRIITGVFKNRWRTLMSVVCPHDPSKALPRTRACT